MSYINDALHKIQKEKESPYAAYGDVVLTEGKKPAARKTWSSVAGLLIIFFFAAGLVALLYWPDDSEPPQTAALVQSPDVATARPTQGMPRPEVLKTASSRPEASTEVAAPLSAKVEKMPAAGKVLPAKVQEKKQNAIIPDNKMKQKASPVADSVSLYTQALQKHREGRLEEAGDLYEQFIQKEPRHIQALNNLGVVNLKLKRYDGAMIRFHDALDIQPNYGDAHYNLACLYAQKNDTEQSLFYLKNAIDINPEFRQWAVRDDDLKNLVDLPEFNKTLQAQDH